MRQRVLVVTGPTASGKSGLALELATRLNGEIIGADSMQIYRDLNVGTAKPTAAQQAAVRHHLVDICEIGERFSVAAWKQAAESAIDDILSRGKLPIVCGGTAQYIFALLDNLTFSGPVGDEQTRLALRKRAEQEGGEALLAELAALDAEAAAKLHPNDTLRIVRALELAGGGMTKSRQNSLSHGAKKYDFTVIWLDFEDRAALYSRIDDRVDQMLSGGMIDEAKLLFSSSPSTAAQAIGYKELADYLAGSEPLQSAAARIKQATRNYAKRQLTWFRRLGEDCRITMDNCENPLKTALELAESGRFYTPKA